jgi:gliding motility-associated-like protein
VYSSRPADTDTPVFSLIYSDASLKDGVVYLRWSSSGFSDIVNTVFVLQRSSAETWSDIATVYGVADVYTVYNDSVHACGDSISYRAFAGIPDLYDTVWLGISDIKTLFVEDKVPPEYVPLDSVSVDMNGNLCFGWSRGVSADAEGYIILSQSGESAQGGLDFTRFNDISQTGYDTLLPRSQALALEFKLQVFDRCDNRSRISDGLFAAASEITYNGCDDKVSVKYGAAGNSLENPDRLLLYGLRQNGESAMVTDAPYALNHVFTMRSSDISEFVAFRIVARNSVTGISASAYVDSFTVLPPPVPKEFHITSVSVNEDGTVTVLPNADTSVLFGSVELYRSDDGTAFEKVIDWKNPPDIWIDNNINAAERNYCYYGVISDTCGRAVHESEVHTTMLLTAAVAGENLFRFSWNAYEGWSDGVDVYGIYETDRQNSSVFTLIDSVYGTTYDLTVQLLEEAFGTQYFVEAIARPKVDTSVNSQDTALSIVLSRSNIVTLETTDLPDFFMPTGFVPDGRITTEYKPVGNIRNISEYDFRIYDRTGKMIFRSKDPATGWDGTVHGKKIPAGVYIYYIFIKKGDKITDRTGNITLVR